MVKQQSCHKLIYKLSSKRLKEARWNLTLPLQEAIKNKNDIVVKAGGLEDRATFIKVAKPDPAYKVTSGNSMSWEK